MFPRLFPLLLACLVLAAVLPAQRTLVVDQSDGPGTHYRDLPEAVGAARDGDRIIVRKGIYKPFRTDKGLSLVGEDMPVILEQPPWDIVIIDRMPAGIAFAMQGFRLETPQLDGPLLVAVSNSGRVHLERVEIGPRDARPSGPVVNPLFGMRIAGCHAVTLTDCESYPGLEIIASHVRVVRGRFRGVDMVRDAQSNVTSSSGIEADISVLDLTGSVATGGNGILSSSSPPMPAVRARGAEIVLRAGGSYVGGLRLLLDDLRQSKGERTYALGGEGTSRLTMDPAVYLERDLEGNRHVGFTGAIVRRLPALLIANVGARRSIEIVGTQGQIFALLASLPAAPTALPWFGDMWLDAFTLVPVLAGIQDRSEHFEVSIPRLPFPFLRGIPLVFQTMHFDFVSIALSNPAVVVMLGR